MEETILNKLREEHQALNFLMDEVIYHPELSKRSYLFKLIKSELVPHMKGEEQSIYAKLRKEIDGENVEKIARQSDQEHHAIREYIQRLNLMNIESDEWFAQFKELRGIVKKHCKNEEETLFPEAKEDFSKNELIQIASEYEEIKHRQL